MGKGYEFQCKRTDGPPHSILTPEPLETCTAYVHGKLCGARLVQRAGPRKKKQ